jgi:hypothetical protein
MLLEILVALEVQRCERYLIGHAAGRDPHVVDRAGRARVGRGVARWCGVYEKYMEGASGVDGRWMGLATPVVSKHPGACGRFGWVVRAQSLPTEGSPAAKVFLPVGFGSTPVLAAACT